MTKSELFTHACEVNALRKEAQLPLRDTREIIRAEQNRLAWEEYGHSVEQHRAVYEALRERVRQDYLRAEKGDIALSVGGQRLLAYRTHDMFQQFLASAGYSRPQLLGVRYGSGK